MPVYTETYGRVRGIMQPGKDNDVRQAIIEEMGPNTMKLKIRGLSGATSSSVECIQRGGRQGGCRRVGILCRGTGRGLASWVSLS